MPRLNPFRPGSLVTPGMFAGRATELVAFEQALWQTKCGNPENLSIMGERGIGKSSLFFLYSAIAAGTANSLQNVKFGFVVVSISLEPSMTQSDILRSMGGELRKAASKKFPKVGAAKDFWDFLKRWEAFGVTYADKLEADMRPLELLEQITVDISKVSEKVRSEGGDGLLFLIDEADKPSAATGKLGLTLKMLTEALSRDNSMHTAFFLAGLPGLLTTLRESHESSSRIFKPLVLNVLEEQDIKKVVAKGLEQANAQNAEQTIIDEDAAMCLCELSEGFPHFIQQYAYSAFARDTDLRISLQDVNEGAYEKGGAIEELGRKYFEELYYDRINSEDYRHVLRAMADSGDGWVTKRTLKDKSKIKEATITNALNVLRERRLIIPKSGVRGSYRLPSDSFAKWIKQCGKRDGLA